MYVWASTMSICCCGLYVKWIYNGDNRVEEKKKKIRNLSYRNAHFDINVVENIILFARFATEDRRNKKIAIC